MKLSLTGFLQWIETLLFGKRVLLLFTFQQWKILNERDKEHRIYKSIEGLNIL